MTYDTCSVCGAIVEQDRVNITTDWQTDDPRTERHVLHEDCARSTVGALALQ